MKSNSINEIKKELKELNPDELIELCLSLARYKKDNKEYLGYLIFNANNKADFVSELKKEIDFQFGSIDRTINLYYIKKSLRKILRMILKYCKYLRDTSIWIDLHIYFCKKIIEYKIPVNHSQQLINLYLQELKKINALLESLHPDLRADYNADIEFISTKE